MKKVLTEQEIEMQMEKALDRIPFEIKKIKFALGVIKRIKKLKMIFKFKIYNQNDKLACIGETIQVFLDSEGELMLTFPPFFEEWKKKVGLL